MCCLIIGLMFTRELEYTHYSFFLFQTLVPLTDYFHVGKYKKYMSGSD